MIGVIADSAEHDVVREFFELFKTPWEFWQRDRDYEVVLHTGGGLFDGAAKLVVYYAGRRTHGDVEQTVPTGGQRRHNCILSHGRNRIPIYGDTITFGNQGSGLLADEESWECVAYSTQAGGKVRVRVGYDLFREVHTLLTVGQPLALGHLPALELHIAFLRGLIIGCGISLAEIPPAPEGHPFVVCLTHDVDHPSIRLHKWDHTVFGFFYRAVFGSLADLFRRRGSVRTLLENWAAALKLPLVYLGLAKDFWRDFDERYLQLESGLPSTFFAIPFKDDPGKDHHRGRAPKFRAARYGAQDIAGILRRLTVAGCEVGLHGIDAWMDSSRGQRELEEIRRAAEVSAVGVRMHWLYHDAESPVVLERAGAVYDSSIGYNETVGYRAGTTQVYKPLPASRLLELPLHVMDTALFYPAHLNCSPQEAKTLLGPMVENVTHHGGCLTINWHDRSLAPERMWNAFYRDLVEDLKNRGAWFATASQAVSWFQKRRSAVFEPQQTNPGALRVKLTDHSDDNLPGLRLRTHKTQELGGTDLAVSKGFVDVAIESSLNKRPLEGKR